MECIKNQPVISQSIQISLELECSGGGPRGIFTIISKLNGIFAFSTILWIGPKKRLKIDEITI
jgi:hypothetical protein